MGKAIAALVIGAIVTGLAIMIGWHVPTSGLFRLCWRCCFLQSGWLSSTGPNREIPSGTRRKSGVAMDGVRFRSGLYGGNFYRRVLAVNKVGGRLCREQKRSDWDEGRSVLFRFCYAGGCTDARQCLERQIPISPIGERMFCRRKTRRAPRFLLCTR